MGEGPAFLERNPATAICLASTHEDQRRLRVHIPLLPLRNPRGIRASNLLVLHTSFSLARTPGLQITSQPSPCLQCVPRALRIPFLTILFTFTTEKTWVSQGTWLCIPHTWTGDAGEIYPVIQAASSFPALLHSGCESHICKTFAIFPRQPPMSFLSLLSLLLAVDIVTNFPGSQLSGVSLSKSA